MSCLQLGVIKSVFEDSLQTFTESSTFPGLVAVHVQEREAGGRVRWGSQVLKHIDNALRSGTSAVTEVKIISQALFAVAPCFLSLSHFK